MSEFAGTLREQIVIERRVDGRTSSGLRLDSWERVASCRAAIRSESWGAQEEAASLSALPRFRVVVRRRIGLQVDQRLRWGDRVLRVRQIVDDPGRPDRLVLKCEEERG